VSFRTVATVDELRDDTPLACDVTDELTVASTCAPAPR